MGLVMGLGVEDGEGVVEGGVQGLSLLSLLCQGFHICSCRSSTILFANIDDGGAALVAKALYENHVPVSLCSLRLQVPMLHVPIVRNSLQSLAAFLAKASRPNCPTKVRMKNFTRRFLRFLHDLVKCVKSFEESRNGLLLLLLARKCLGARAGRS